MLAYKNYGKGTKVVLLHGFCENSTCFNEQVFLLQDHVEVTTINLPGVEDSPLIKGLTMEKIADAVKATFEKAGIEKCILIGHSMGGYATLAFAKKYSEFLSGIGLIHSTAAADTPERQTKRDQAIRFIEENGASAYTSNFVPPLFSEHNQTLPVVQQLVAEADKLSAESLTESLLSMKMRPESISFLERTPLPVLFVVGKNDTLIPEKAMMEQASLCKASSVVYLEQSAHMGMIEEAAKCAAGIKEFAAYVESFS